MQILQLNPPIYVLTPKGDALARLVIDYSPDINTIWVVDLINTRECIHVDSSEIRFSENLMWNLKRPEMPRRKNET
jgi:hypothetical protein